MWRPLPESWFDSGPLDTVGWGPFALPGERKRLRLAEQRRLKELKKNTQDERVAAAKRANEQAIAVATQVVQAAQATAHLSDAEVETVVGESPVIINVLSGKVIKSFPTSTAFSNLDSDQIVAWLPDGLVLIVPKDVEASKAQGLQETEAPPQ